MWFIPKSRSPCSVYPPADILCKIICTEERRKAPKWISVAKIQIKKRTAWQNIDNHTYTNIDRKTSFHTIFTHYSIIVKNWALSISRFFPIYLSISPLGTEKDNEYTKKGLTSVLYILSILEMLSPKIINCQPISCNSFLKKWQYAHLKYEFPLARWEQPSASPSPPHISLASQQDWRKIRHCPNWRF